MNSLVRKALLGTNRRRGPFFTIVYLHIDEQQSCLTYHNESKSFPKQGIEIKSMKA